MSKATEIMTDQNYMGTPNKLKHLETNAKIVRVQLEPVFNAYEVEFRLEDNSSLILTSRSRSYSWRAA